MTTPKRGRYFVRQLGETDSRPSPRAAFEVQILNDQGQGEVCAYIAADSDQVVALHHAAKGWLSVGEHGVPEPVIRTAKQMRGPYGEYVNENGEVVPPAFLQI